MPKEFSRTLRVADQIQRNLARIIQQEVADPRVGMVNINDVDVSPDYANAQVFVTFIDSDDERQAVQSVAALNKAAGFLRGHLARSLNSRTTPRLHFEYDRTAISGQRLSKLIDDAVSQDRRRHQK